MRAASAAVTWGAARQALERPFFAGVQALLHRVDGPDWPSLLALNALAAERGTVNARGTPIRFVPPTDAVVSAMRYETSIAESGEIPTRDNWHDLFNALQWIAFPRSKAAINAQHVRLLTERGAGEARARSVPRDVLTMFDESGIIVTSADASLLALIRTFRWRELFVDRRHDVIANMRFVLVGHGLMEKALNPFVGITAKAMLLSVDATVPIDATAAAWLGDDGNLASSQYLAPLPLLGIPGWDARNESAVFYDNTDYFRRGRRAGAEAGA